MPSIDDKFDIDKVFKFLEISIKLKLSKNVISKINNIFSYLVDKLNNNSYEKLIKLQVKM